MTYLIAFVATLLVAVPAAEVLKTKKDRRSLQENGVDIGVSTLGVIRSGERLEAQIRA